MASSSSVINNLLTTSCSSYSSYRHEFLGRLPPYLLSFNTNPNSITKRSLASTIRTQAGFVDPQTAISGLNVTEAVTQVYRAFQKLENSVGLNPDDPIIPFVLVLGASATLWGLYWIFTSGNAEDLSPQSTLELLKGQEDVALIDIRPDDIRERDGIPDLRRAARFRYVNVTTPEVDVAVKKLLKRGKNLDDMLVAAVIRNLNVVQDRSKIIVMDANGARSKGVVKSLKRLGIKNPYLLQGGFQSWIKDGLRIKELRPETPLQILNEEAEAIIEEFNPTPFKLLGYGLAEELDFQGSILIIDHQKVDFWVKNRLSKGRFSVVYEWEKTLQLIGIIGIVQTVYRRLASYEDAEDLKKDVRVMLGPVKVGGEAISWAAAKLEEANRNGLTTAPSSVDVQKRVLQAAAKHESQPTTTTSKIEEAASSGDPSFSAE